MFQVPEFAPVHLCIQCTVAGITGAGFPIRTSSVQSLCSNSPKLFAATNVLHRLLVPRYPPCALSSLTSFSQRRLFHSQNERLFWATLSVRPRLVARRIKNTASLPFSGRRSNSSQKPPLICLKINTLHCKVLIESSKQTLIQ